MFASSPRFRRERQDLLAGTATELLVEMGSRIRALQIALAKDDEQALAAIREALPIIRTAIERLVATGLDAGSLATLSAAVRALPEDQPA
jgi:hypothetical protein